MGHADFPGDTSRVSVIVRLGAVIFWYRVLSTQGSCFLFLVWWGFLKSGTNEKKKNIKTLVAPTEKTL